MGLRPQLQEWTLTESVIVNDTARGIKGVEKNGNSDGMVELWVGKEKKNPLKTKVYDDTLTPQWHEEFIFTLPDASPVISFMVLDWNRIMKNVPLGSCELEPSKVLPNVGLDMWLPLDTQGELHIFVQATPLAAAPAKPKSLRLGSFRMNVERAVYFPGEAVRGAIIYNVGKPRKIRGVRVRFEGATRVSWSESRRRGDKNVTIYFRAHYVYFNPIATLYGNPRGQKKDFKIPSGGYYWPFEFNLPLNLAPSFFHGIGQNAYFVKGYVDIPMAVDKTVTQKLTMTCEYSQLHPTINVKFSKKAKALLASNQNISVALAAPEIAYMGENFPIDVSIDHQGTKDVKEVLIKLKAKYYFTARNAHEGWKTRVVKKNVMSHKVAGVAGFPIPPGTKWNGQIQVPIPGALPPSVPDEVSPIVQVYYHFKATMNTTGNVFTKASNTKKLAILLGERVPFQPVIVTTVTTTAAPAPQIMVAQAPANIYEYLAPAPITGEEISYVGPVMSHEQFVAAQPFQPEQWVENEEGAVAYSTTEVAGINSSLSDVQGE
jgi:hypothetical protein